MQLLAARNVSAGTQTFRHNGDWSIIQLWATDAIRDPFGFGEEKVSPQANTDGERYIRKSDDPAKCCYRGGRNDNSTQWCCTVLVRCLGKTPLPNVISHSTHRCGTSSQVTPHGRVPRTQVLSHSLQRQAQGVEHVVGHE